MYLKQTNKLIYFCSFRLNPACYKHSLQFFNVIGQLTSVVFLYIFVSKIVKVSQLQIKKYCNNQLLT